MIGGRLRLPSTANLIRELSRLIEFDFAFMG